MQEAERAIEQLRRWRNWSAGTAESHLAAMTPVAARMTAISGKCYASWLPVLIRRAKWENLSLGPKWSPADSETMLSRQQYEQLKSLAKQGKALALAGWLAAGSGVRIGDALKLYTTALSGACKQDHPVLLGPSLLFILHKTMTSVGPWSLHLQEGSEIVKALEALQEQRRREGKHFLFLAAAATASRQQIAAEVSRAEQWIKRQIHCGDLRGCRRLGLAMASARAEDDRQVLQLSQHKGLEALRTYLGAGALSRPIREAQLKLTTL